MKISLKVIDRSKRCVKLFNPKDARQVLNALSFLAWAGLLSFLEFACT